MELKAFGWVRKDEASRRLHSKSEINKFVLKSLLYTSEYPALYRIYFSKKFYMFSKRSSLSVYRRYGMFSFIGKSVFRRFKLNRHFVKANASNGFLVGLRKSSF